MKNIYTLNIYTLNIYLKKGKIIKLTEIERVNNAITPKKRAKELSSLKEQTIFVHKNGEPYGIVEFPIYWRNQQIWPQELVFIKY